ncbi:MAG: hypothetical protein E7214_14765 [Clostridium sp.]|nr:hypothetical protein [Clostridium sp.]
MSHTIGIYKIYPDTFRANVYTTNPFRMIGLIDVGIMYNDGMETVTLPFFRSSGTNSGKIQGLWYPIVGLKLETGSFNEFTPYLNYVLTNTTRHGQAANGWLAKSLFFANVSKDSKKIRGFSGGKHYKSLLRIGQTLTNLYESNQYIVDESLYGKRYNKIIISNEVYKGNKHSQRENFEKFISEIFNNI